MAKLPNQSIFRITRESYNEYMWKISSAHYIRACKNTICPSEKAKSEIFLVPKTGYSRETLSLGARSISTLQPEIFKSMKIVYEILLSYLT